jgi:hypothetical protein
MVLAPQRGREGACPRGATVTTPILVLARSFHNKPVLAVGVS